MSGLRTGGVVVGVLLALLGGVWIGQGLGYIKGSFMTGSPFWAEMGVLSLVAGLFLGGLSAFVRRSGAR